jgi:hypothetical protein
MAYEGIGYTPGSGKNVAGDAVGGNVFQRIKVAVGDEGTAFDVSATNPMPVDTLAALGVARQLAAGAASANTALTTTCRRVSIHARTADIRYVIGTGAQTASATSHFIAAGERLDLDVPASAQIAVIRAGSTDGVLELSELT